MSLDEPLGLENGAANGSLAVVGAGVVGLAQAWAAAKRGFRVTVFERDSHCVGASVRNFGMVWPIGQPNGPLHRAALLSRGLWLEFLADAGLPHRRCGSLHLAYREDELAVIREFAEASGELGYDCELLSPEAAAAKSPAVRRDAVLGALWSPTEVGVNPRVVIREMPRWLESKYGVRFRFGVTVESVAGRVIRASDGSMSRASRVVVAAGSDFRRLYPDLYRRAGFKLCKLQMLATAPQPKGWDLGPMIAGGLTLRHYESFGVCGSLGRLKQRVAEETPELDEYGVHVMVSQNEQGELILGDSHEYSDDPSPFDQELIDELILRELQQIVEVPDWTITRRWHGVYPKRPNCTELEHEPEPGVRVVVASGGCGMTMSFGLAEERFERVAAAAGSVADADRI